MKIDQSFLDSFINGTLYLRFPSFDFGPDWYYLFRSTITDIVSVDTGVCFEHKHQFPNRFKDCAWTEHWYDIRRIFWFTDQGEFKIISPGIMYIKLDETGEIVIYANDTFLPDLNPFRNFPQGHEQMAGLGGIDF